MKMIVANQRGFSYILALTIVMVMGIMLGMVGQSWKSLKQREQEEEMIYRGDQVAEIIYQRYKCMGLPNINQNLWSINSPNGTILDDLVIGKEEKCPAKNGTTVKYRLRSSATIDPMTGKQWKIATPIGDVTRMAGVMSESTDEPYRKSFKNIYDSKLLDEKKQYSDWAFTWELKKTVPQIQNQNPIKKP
jgi:type II secretory pathway pseudopilin PulG